MNFIDTEIHLYTVLRGERCGSDFFFSIKYSYVIGKNLLKVLVFVFKYFYRIKYLNTISDYKLQVFFTRLTTCRQFIGQAIYRVTAHQYHSPLIFFDFERNFAPKTRSTNARLHTVTAANARLA